MLSNNSKQYIYKISNIILKWSLVYMIVLFFLEDLKPFLVSTVFSPHWILLILAVNLLLVIVLAPYGHESDKSSFLKKINNSQKLNQIDIWVFRVIIIGFVLLWLPAIWGLLGFWGFIMLALLSGGSERVLRNLFD